MNNREITWELWEKPFSKEKEFTKEEDVKEDGGVATKKYKDSFEEAESIDTEIRPVLITDMGPLPIKMWGEFSETFPIWVGHCNFYVTQEIKEAVMAVPGVILFKPATAYEFRVSFGKMFAPKKVRTAIQKVLGAYPRLEGEDNPLNLRLDAVLKARAVNLIDELKEQGKFWTILVLPNGEIDSFATNNEEDCVSRYDTHKQIQGVTGAIVYASEMGE